MFSNLHSARRTSLIPSSCFSCTFCSRLPLSFSCCYLACLNTLVSSLCFPLLSVPFSLNGKIKKTCWTGEPSSSLYIHPSFSVNEGTDELERRGEIKEGKRKGTGELIPALEGEWASLCNKQLTTCFSLIFPSMCFAHLVLCILSRARKSRKKLEGREQREEVG